MLTALGFASMVFVLGFTWYQATHSNQGTGQSKRSSIAEAWVNICIGFSVNFGANLVLFPLMVGVQVSAEANWWGGWIYTAISVCRQYAIRRWFNRRIHVIAAKLGGDT